MLIQILLHQPRMLGTILAHTPLWVWGLLAGLLALGVSQLFERQVGRSRTLVLPLSMTALSVYGLVSALGGSGALTAALAAWAATAVVTALLSLAWRATPPVGSHYDATRAQWTLPGSAVPLMLILAIFLTKYGVGVELAMQPQHVQDGGFVYGLAAVYGAFNGILIARTARLWRLVRSSAGASPALTA